ncbi:MAG: signal peptidase II [Turicibacter sp.]
MLKDTDTKGVVKYMWLIAAISIITILIDQISKWLIQSMMTQGQSIPIIDGFLYITSHRNAGAAWGIFQGRMGFFYLVTAIVIGVVIFWLTRLDLKKETLLAIALAFILGGAIGNFIDRIFLQHVVDFIDVIIFGYDFPIFNVADSALTIGVVLMAIDTIREMLSSRNSVPE